MKRTRLRNKFLNSKKDIDRREYNKQSNLCVSLIRRKTKDFYSKLNTRDINDNRTFWKTVKPLFTDKILVKSKITLVEKKVISGEENVTAQETITDDTTVTEVFNKFFC